MSAIDSSNAKIQTTSTRETQSTTLAELADLVGGRLLGDGSLIISGAEIISRACQGEITLADQPNLSQQLAQSRASAVLISANIDHGNMHAILVEDVRSAFSQIVSHLYPQPRSVRTGISPDARVNPLAQLDHDVDIHMGASIDQHVVIGRGSTIHSGVRIMAGCVIGENVTIFPNAVLYPQTHIGDRSILHAGAVMGGYGFGYQFQDGSHQLGAQLGYVVVGKQVEIGVNTTIDRGTFGATSIGDGTKIDNQVQVGHNCQIGKHNLICSQVGIAGSVSTGDYVVIAGQVGFADHVHIGNHATIGAKSGIMNNVADGLTVVGYPATPIREQKLKQAAWTKLPEMRKHFRKMQRQISQLEEQLSQQSAIAQTDDQAA
jgi:UDP-3-O-[3-hydroxymyristoyl] glucosamine N-acyltransferase